jgi:DNA-binding HxlR family transcriptional regulator
MDEKRKEGAAMKKKYNLPCNIANTLDLVGDRWTLLIVRDLLAGKTKFNELKQSLAGIAPNILSDRLQVLEKEELVRSHLYSKHPPRYEYELTEEGQKLEHVLNALAIWGNRHFQQKYYDITVPGCRHEAEITYSCKECGTTADHVLYRDSDNPGE